MRARTAVMIVLAASACACAPNTTRLRTDSRLQRVTGGLMAFRSPPAAMQAMPDTAQGHPLAERMALYKVPGVGIAVIDDFRIAWTQGYGVVRADGGAPVTPDTWFEAASTTKLLVATIALHLVERGRLDLDTDINAYLRSWRVPENAFTRERAVTLRLLLTHRAGFPSGSFAEEEGPPPTLVQVLRGEKPALNKPAVVEFTPGSRWQYSNIGYVILQQLLEDVAGEPLERIARVVVFDPLGMESSTLAYPLPEGERANEAVPHCEEGIARAPAMHATALAQGGLMTTPHDLARFAIELMRAYRGRSDRLLGREMAARMFTPETTIDPAVLGMPLGQGLGVLLYGAGEGLLFTHPGENIPGATCWLMGNPGAGKGIVVMTNGAMGNLLALEILPAVIREHGWPMAGQADMASDP
ncbi:MAG: beta-lactamase family protein [Candidatus Krumholzibacteriota bacterium]|nr:beta-lactamase family protein [Candidatus Krumholzibacteriota bacterium]